MSGNLSKNNNTELKIPQSLETTEGSAILPSLKQEAASIPAQLPEKLEINLSKSIYDSSRSIPKVIEATGVLTLGGLFYLFAGESGFNTYLGISNKIFGNIWGGATFENIASMNDKQLEENLNPLHHLSKVVEPIIQPLNLLSRQATDRLNFYGYNVYLRSTGSSQVTFEEYQIRKIDPENWELRAGENTLYALEALGIAYLMVTRGGLAKSGINLISKGCVGEANFALLLKEGSDLLTLMRMPVFMSALSSIGDILDRKEDPKNPPLISLDTCYQCITGITNGTFDSLVFMSFISAVSKSVVTFESIRKAKAVDYSQHMQKVVSYTEAASEATDISEGLPDFYKNCENSKAKLLSAIFSPSGQTWQELIGASLKLVASALDLVDRKQSGESRRLAELPSNLQQTLQGDRTLAEQFANIGKVVASEHGDILFLEDAGKVSELYQRRAEVLRYKLEENLFSFTGLKSLLTSPSARLADYFTFSGLAKSLTNFGRTEKAKITAASKNVSAFFDPELGLTVAALPKTEIEKERYLGYSAHEAIHREISQLGLEEFLETDTGSRLSDKIQNYMGVNLENLLSESHGRLRAEELLAHLAEYEVLCGVGLEKLEDAGITIPFLQHENLYFNDYHRILD
ncbi:MAG: hypothetical protein KBC84_05095, partial [Proteobacteria bacterium]|nr:hypothetical protein [Pseudomonadota bacterium]